MESLKIDKIDESEIESLQLISRETFYETFAAMNTPENMAHYLENNLSLESLSNELNDSNSAFYFARIEGAIAGYLKLNFGGAQKELQDPNAVEIERIYVRSAYQGRAVGQALYDLVLEVAKDRSAQYVWLGVWEENARAIRFYEKNGFVPFGTHIFKLGDDPQTDILMKRSLID
jgi:ribosomal protein S18 acetylase RimI-like enzyme